MATAHHVLRVMLVMLKTGGAMHGKQPSGMTRQRFARAAMRELGGLVGWVHLKEVILMKPYDAEFRGEVLAACDTNEERRLIVLCFKVSDSWVRRIQQQRRETGQVAAKKAAPRQPKWQAWADWLVAKIAAGRTFICASCKPNCSGNTAKPLA